MRGGEGQDESDRGIVQPKSVADKCGDSSAPSCSSDDICGNLTARRGYGSGVVTSRHNSRTCEEEVDGRMVSCVSCQTRYEVTQEFRNVSVKWLLDVASDFSWINPVSYVL